jgi:hypothetical protein
MVSDRLTGKVLGNETNQPRYSAATMFQEAVVNITARVYTCNSVWISSFKKKRMDKWHFLEVDMYNVVNRCVTVPSWFKKRENHNGAYNHYLLTNAFAQSIALRFLSGVKNSFL